MAGLKSSTRHRRTSLRWFGSVLVLGWLAGAGSACNSIMNSWLDPTVLGSFERTGITEIRSSLTLEDTPSGVPGAVYPTPDDLVVNAEEYPILPGDTFVVEVFELRQRLVPYQAQVTVSSTGYVNLPVVGRVLAEGLTVPELEKAIVQTLQEAEVLRDPVVTVNALYLQTATYSVFGVGVSAADNAPLRAGTFPIRRPDLRLLEAINQVGGLNEFVSDIYLFRYDTPEWKNHRRTAAPPAQAPAEGGRPRVGPESPPSEMQNGSDPRAPREPQRPAVRSPEDQLMDAVIGGERGEESVPGKPQGERVPDVLAPGPYVYVNHAFVPNPEYSGRSSGMSTPSPGPAMWDGASPAVSWARIAEDTSYRVIRIPAELLRSGDPEVNIVVRAGDVIRISTGEIGVYYVMGQVNRIGAFSFNAEPITLKAAIAGAGGLSELAWPDRCTVYRRLGQREQMIQVNLDRIFAGKDPDFYIRRGDIINVGTHPFAPFLERIRAWTLPNPASNVGYSFVYSRNFADIDSFSARINPHNEVERFPALFP